MTFTVTVSFFHELVKLTTGCVCSSWLFLITSARAWCYATVSFCIRHADVNNNCAFPDLLFHWHQEKGQTFAGYSFTPLPCRVNAACRCTAELTGLHSIRLRLTIQAEIGRLTAIFVCVWMMPRSSFQHECSAQFVMTLPHVKSWILSQIVFYSVILINMLTCWPRS